MIKTHEVYYPLYEDKEKFIILITGGRGCEDPETPVMMHDLTIKKIKDVKVGDKVMGDDGTPRNVLDVVSGRSMMYRVKQTSAEDYIVNDSHIITVKKSESSKREGRYKEYADITDINIEEYYKKPNRFQSHFRGYKIGSIPYPEKDVKIEPYMLGLWLGDGTAIFPNITNPEPEVREYLEGYCERHNQNLNGEWKNGAWHMRIVGDGKMGHNDFLNSLNAYNLINNKHIPQDYISNSEEVRLELLAGILDTDGEFSRGGYSITQKSESLSRQIKFIADTLGFRTSIRTRKARCNGKDCGTYYRVGIGGDVWRIPCKVGRKIARKEEIHKNKDWHLSQLSVEPIGIGDYCGLRLDGNQRYLHADGTVTHNSGKSFGVGTFIERLTFELGIDEDSAKRIAHQILYTRYTMVSADISVIPEFWEKVEADGTERYFHKTQKDVINKKTGSRIMFRGIKTSSGNQTAKLKSIHGITTFIVDEAEEWTSEQEFDTIMFSIRQKGLQNRIVIIMNPTDSNHFIYQKYIKDTHKIVDYDGVPVQISTHPNVLHIHTTYLDNLEHVAEQFIKEVKEMKERNPEKYAHVIMGQWADVAEGAVYKKWGVVDSFPQHLKKVARGLDFGFTNDPSACVRCGIDYSKGTRDLYIEEKFYKTGMLIKDLVDELKRDDSFVYADSADPRLIQEIANHGIIIYPVAKTSGSINAGIEGIKDFDNIYITKDSYNMQFEMRNYVWAKNKDGNYINIPEDANNHLCFVRGTMITTKRGLVPIENMQEGDIVLNSNGWHKVKRFFDNGVKEVYTYTITTEEGDIEVRCTPNHKVKTENGWKHISELQEGDKIFLHKSSMERHTDCLMKEISSITSKDRGEENVYNFEVEDVHEYFANGLLVSNCDAMRYWYLGGVLGQVVGKMNVNKARLGIF